MSTQEERRRAIGINMEQARRQSGLAMEANRRAIGEAMIQRRTGQDMVTSLNRLTPPARQRKVLTQLDARGAQPPQRGTGSWVESRPGTATGGGVAWPLTEENFDARQYWPNGQASSDGLFFFPAIKSLVLADANGNGGTVNLAKPPEPAP